MLSQSKPTLFATGNLENNYNTQWITSDLKTDLQRKPMFNEHPYVRNRIFFPILFLLFNLSISFCSKQLFCQFILDLTSFNLVWRISSISSSIESFSFFRERLKRFVTPLCGNTGMQIRVAFLSKSCCSWFFPINVKKQSSVVLILIKQLWIIGQQLDILKDSASK